MSRTKIVEFNVFENWESDDDYEKTTANILPVSLGKNFETIKKMLDQSNQELTFFQDNQNCAKLYNPDVIVLGNIKNVGVVDTSGYEKLRKKLKRKRKDHNVGPSTKRMKTEDVKIEEKE